MSRRPALVDRGRPGTAAVTRLARLRVKIYGDGADLDEMWASPRELLDVFQADEVGCHIITVTADIFRRIELIGKDLTEFSLDTVRMFRDDAAKAGFTL